MKVQNKLFYILLFVLALIVNFSGINVKFFTDDPGLYASIAKNLIYKKDFLQLFTYNQDWLDKPHFPFWMVLCSFKLFGISEWAYRLPALLFFMLSALYTWLFSNRYYGVEVAAIAVLILMTSLSIIMSNTDVRAEPYLMAFVIGSIYHVARLHERYKLPDLILAALLTACALMTKGLFVMVAIYGGLLGQVLFERRFKSLFSWKWLFLALLIIVFIMPECYALYIQFDAHPEKIVFGRQHVSGIRWFLWDSQFGRFVNSGPISQKRSGDPLFYLHTLLWAFAPWCLLFYYAVFKNLKEIWRKQKLAEYYTLCGGLVLLMLFSLSRFQLPFYTNTIFPFFAILTAPFCCKQLSRFGKTFRMASYWLYGTALVLATLMIDYFASPGHQFLFVIECIVFALVAAVITFKVDKSYLKGFFLTFLAALFANLYLNTIFYHVVAGYNGQIKAAEYLNLDTSSNYHIFSLKFQNNIFQFYSKRQTGYISVDKFKTFNAPPHSIFFASRESKDFLLQNHAELKVIKAFPNYPQEIIYPAFINRSTRDKTLDSVYLITK